MTPSVRITQVSHIKLILFCLWNDARIHFVAFMGVRNMIFCCFTTLCADVGNSVQHQLLFDIFPLVAPIYNMSCT